MLQNMFAITHDDVNFSVFFNLLVMQELFFSQVKINDQRVPNKLQCT